MICTVEGCERLIHARGLCGKHYQAGRYQPAPLSVTRPPHAEAAECDRWVAGMTNGCPHFRPEHWRALAAAGQLPPMALALELHL